MPNELTTTIYGLTAENLHGYIAALGITRLVPGTQLRWTTERTVPTAEYTHTGNDLLETLEKQLNKSLKDDIEHIAKYFTPGTDTEDKGEKLTLNRYTRYAAEERERNGWTLSAFATDLKLDYERRPVKSDLVAFPSAKGTTPASQLENIRESFYDEPPKAKGRSISEDLKQLKEGTAQRTNKQGGGLGCSPNQTFIPHIRHGAGKWIVPIAELLYFYGLQFFPTRPQTTYTAWPVWDTPLDGDAIDALLDIGTSREVLALKDGKRSEQTTTTCRLYGITGIYIGHTKTRSYKKENNREIYGTFLTP